MRSLLSGPDLASEDIFTFHAEHQERVRQMAADQTSMLAFLRNSIASPSPSSGSGQWQDVAGVGTGASLGQGRAVGRARVLLPGLGALLTGGYGSDTRSTGNCPDNPSEM